MYRANPPAPTAGRRLGMAVWHGLAAQSGNLSGKLFHVSEMQG